MDAAASGLAKAVWTSFGGQENAASALSFTGEGDLPAAYAVTDFATAAIAAAALSVAELAGRALSGIPPVTVDRRLSSFWFGWSIRPIGWTMPAPWDPIAGDYRTSDGWIRLHTNAPHHRAAAEQVLGRHGDRTGMARAVAPWAKADLEAAIVDAGGCAAEMRSSAEWMAHPQGRAVAAEPLAHIVATDRADRSSSWTPTPSRPLAGLRVLDLTRVLAGPVATRFLAGYGAEVLRIDPPGWDEPGVIPEVTLGKRCARLDLEDDAGRERFEALLAQADMLLHGYRPGALDRLGYDPATRRFLAPGLIDVSLNAYGWSGPWATRRGFDSLVQMSTGIAETGMHWRQSDRPVPLPVQALDHATGYFMAATAIRAVTRRLGEGLGTEARLSLARTARLLADGGPGNPSSPLLLEAGADLSLLVECTDWGDAQRLAPPAVVAGAAMHWACPARKLGSAAAVWP
ncbi:MAG: CoA transferase [Verrucomicrobia bacterium]|nr:CoA transferase [Verrucomicrobiota bacterium]